MGRRAGEESQRRAELQRIDIAKDLFGGPPFEPFNQHAAFEEPRTQHRMRQIGDRFIEGRQRNFRDIVLSPSPAICGKTNHIQWLRFAPALSSLSTSSYTRS